MAKTWQFYRSALDADVVQTEIAKCQPKQHERLHLGMIMERTSSDTLLPKDRKFLTSPQR